MIYYLRVSLGMWYLVAADCTLARLCRISPIASCSECVRLDFMSSGVIAGRVSGAPLESAYSLSILYSAAIILSSRLPRPCGFRDPIPAFSDPMDKMSDLLSSLLISDSDMGGLLSAMSSSSLRLEYAAILAESERSSGCLPK